MSKRQLNGDVAGGKKSRLEPPQKKKKHLYLALDDCHKGFSVHKIDPDTLQDAAADLQEEPMVGFPDPPILRLAAQTVSCAMKFAALGSTIFIATNPRCGQTPTLVYDTDTTALTIGPRLPAPLLANGSNISVAAGDTLYGMSAFYSNVRQQHSFEALSQAPPETTVDNQPLSLPRPSMEDWSWKTVSSPPPFGEGDWITSYAVHPDGRTIFMSAHDNDDSTLARGTYSFDTQRCEWRRHGDWVLPFHGEAYFDDELEAWVGLREDGYVCSCQVPSRSGMSRVQPEWKMVGDKLFCKVPRSQQLPGGPCATLAYMGEGRFCLVECVMREGLEFPESFGDHGGCTLHITMFGLKYSHKGELQTKTRHTTSHVVSKHLLQVKPVVFWM